MYYSAMKKGLNYLILTNWSTIWSNSNQALPNVNIPVQLVIYILPTVKQRENIVRNPILHLQCINQIRMEQPAREQTHRLRWNTLAHCS